MAGGEWWAARERETASSVIFAPLWKSRRIKLRTLLLAPMAFGLLTLLSFTNRPHSGRLATSGLQGGGAARSVCTPRFRRRGGSSTVNEWGLDASHTHPWPGGRSGPAVWPSSSGLYIFGGMGYGSDRAKSKGGGSGGGSSKDGRDSDNGASRGQSKAQDSTARRGGGGGSDSSGPSPSTTHLADAWRWSERGGGSGKGVFEYLSGPPAHSGGGGGGGIKAAMGAPRIASHRHALPRHVLLHHFVLF